MADTVLLSEYKEAVKYEVISLSPSNFILDEFDKEISTLISDYGKTNRRIINQTPNDKSVVIYIKIDDQRILLGSDLEVSNDGRKGWKCIVDNCQTIDKKSQIFKLPHHGSVNGYDENVWRSLVDDNSIAKLSPYNKSSLPRKEMLQKFLNHTDCLYSTSFPSNSLKGKPKARNKQITKAIARFNKTLTEVKFQKGIVSCLFDSNSKEWEVKTLEGAGQINNHTIDNFKR